ncbi:Hypothetical predicted protein [Mytilus galloprovincialis]|uniref:Apple domain-containing protein n=1 Tax=Mytilus galloprovincialis TaxID=29158 RepID=A0A8B6EZ60_MYTGA|nr:Hypothetical predicted protein [Mytilus galloprovincialis]
MKIEIRLCVCVALAAVCIVGVRSAGSYGGRSYGGGSYGGGGYGRGVYRRTASYGGSVYGSYGKGGGYRPTSRGGGSLYYPYYYPVPYFVGGGRRRGGNVRVTPAIIARTGGRRRGGGGGGGLFGGGGGGFGGIFSLITGNKSKGSHHGNAIYGADKLQSLALSVEYTIVTANVSVVDCSLEANILDYIVDLRPYGLDSLLSRSFIFEVKACELAVVYLSSSDIMDSAKPLYEITIGSNGNTTVRIRRRSDASLQPSSIISIPRYISNIVSCIIYKPFWITWESGRIMIGLGNIINEFVTSALMDQNPFEVKSFGVSTLTDIVGHWKISLPVKDNFTGHFNSCQDHDKRAVLLSLDVIASSKFRCAMICSQLNNCAVFNYHDQDESCELLSFEMDPFTDFPTVIATGWEYFTKCYEGTDKCVGCFF